jgi:hypothetical protein
MCTHLIKLSSHVKVMDGRLTTIDTIQADERVDFEVSEVKVSVNAVEADEEVNEGLLLGLGDVSQEGVLDGFA